MNNQKSIVEKVVKQVVKRIADHEAYGWPPQCAALYYQPVRPQRKTEILITEEQLPENQKEHCMGN